MVCLASMDSRGAGTALHYARGARPGAPAASASRCRVRSFPRAAGPQQAARVAAPDAARADTARHDASGGDHGSGLDVRSIEQDAVRADPYVVLHHHAAARGHESLLADLE